MDFDDAFLPGAVGRPMSFTGYFPPEDPRESMERHARTGEPMPFSLEVQGKTWAGSVRVTKTGPDSFDCQMLEPLRVIEEPQA